MKTIIESVRASRRPGFVEARTYRYMGHSMSDPAHGHYRTKEEIDEQKKNVPISRLKKEMIEQGEITTLELKKIGAEIIDRISEAVSFADQSSEPAIGKLTEDIYARSLQNLQPLANAPAKSYFL